MNGQEITEVVRYADALVAGHSTWVAIDDNNQQVFGPFETRDQAVAWAVEVMYATGEWDRADAGKGARSNDWDDLNDAGWGIVEMQVPTSPTQFGNE